MQVIFPLPGPENLSLIEFAKGFVAGVMVFFPPVIVEVILR